MAAKLEYALKGVIYESCRQAGHCPLWFRRDLQEGEEGCVNFETIEITQGHIQNIDMKGITIIYVSFGIGPKYMDLVTKGREEGAAYISDKATPEQRKVLEPFATQRLGAIPEFWRKCLGVKFVKIDTKEKGGTHHTTMPYGEQKMTLTVGGDGKNPESMNNPPVSTITNYRFCNTDFWSYHDYGRNLEFRNVSGTLGDFAIASD